MHGLRTQLIPNFSDCFRRGFLKAIGRTRTELGTMLLPSWSLDLIRKSARPIAHTVLCGLLTACYPHPHQYVKTQEYSGVLLKGGVPVAGAVVLISQSRNNVTNYCENPHTATVSSDTGYFHINPTVETKAFTSILNPPDTVLQSTSICFTQMEHQILGATILSRTDRRISYDLNCDLDSMPVEYKQRTIFPKDQWGICRNEKPIAH